MTRTHRGAQAEVLIRASLAAAAVLLLAGAGCKKDVVGAQGAAVQEPGAPVAVTLEGYTIERLELDGASGPLVYKDPVLAVTLKFENKGEKNIFYQPTHSLNKASNLEAPLLFVDPGPEGELRNNISGVFLEEGRLESQQEGNVDLKPGDAVTDTYLFTVPEAEQADLIMTIPPAMHGGKVMLKIKMPYTRAEVPAPKVYGMGEGINVGDTTFTVKSAKVEYVSLKDANAGEGFSKEPVFRVDFEIKNGGKEAMTYEPGHRITGEGLAMALLQDGGSGRYMRAYFGADRDVEGQTGVRESIDAGATHKDFAIFERPPKGVDALQLQVPGKILGGPGLIRVKIPYKWEDPSKPKELEPKKDE